MLGECGVESYNDVLSGGKIFMIHIVAGILTSVPILKCRSPSASIVMAGGSKSATSGPTVPRMWAYPSAQ